MEQNLFDPQKNANQLIKIECEKCGYVGEPKKWFAITLIGIALLLLSANIAFLVPVSLFIVIVFFLIANPYICIKCKERNQLIKILNNKKKIPIKSLSRKAFLIVSITSLVIMSLIYLYQTLKYGFFVI